MPKSIDLNIGFGDCLPTFWHEIDIVVVDWLWKTSISGPKKAAAAATKSNSRLISLGKCGIPSSLHWYAPCLCFFIRDDFKCWFHSECTSPENFTRITYQFIIIGYRLYSHTSHNRSRTSRDYPSSHYSHTIRQRAALRNNGPSSRTHF